MLLLVSCRLKFSWADCSANAVFLPLSPLKHLPFWCLWAGICESAHCDSRWCHVRNLRRDGHRRRPYACFCPYTVKPPCLADREIRHHYRNFVEFVKISISTNILFCLRISQLLVQYRRLEKISAKLITDYPSVPL